jgi:hypothetical protein
MRGRQSQKAWKTTTEDTEKKIEGTESAWWGRIALGGTGYGAAASNRTRKSG